MPNDTPYVSETGSFLISRGLSFVEVEDSTEPLATLDRTHGGSAGAPDGGRRRRDLANFPRNRGVTDGVRTRDTWSHKPGR
jgi:hypothetical protein